MTIRMVRETPPPDLAAKLEEFESVFTYPLGPGRSFRISHFPDYTRFYRSMGDAACFVAEQSDRVVGTLSVAIRDLRAPDLSACKAAYIGDLKVRPDARRSRALVRLARAADAWARPQVTAAYGIVMDGTGRLPEDYSGRAGIEAFRVVGKIIVLRIATDSAGGEQMQPLGRMDLQAVERIDRHMRGKYVFLGGEFNDRSELAAEWLIPADTSAVGALEDTRKAKRLIGNDGIEMVSAHLSGFAFETPESGVKLLRWACAKAKSLGIPALFVSVPESQFRELNEALGPIEKVIAPATIYGAGINPGPDWIINTSEI